MDGDGQIETVEETSTGESDDESRNRQGKYLLTHEHGNTQFLFDQLV